jgi:predicted 3-demethylubiquinone-9 3-methyltransferase (glyoxalase superfamily)
MKPITPCLWFDTHAEEAAQYYTSIFKNSKVLQVSRYPDGAPMPKGTAMMVKFIINGQEFMGLNGGPQFKFTEAVSFAIDCETQQEIDEYWSKLTTDGGKEVQCGWVKDKYGLSWQIVPAIIGELLSKGTDEQNQRLMHAVWRMVKLDINELKKAFEG